MVEFAHRYNAKRLLIWAMSIPKSNPDNILYHLEEAYEHIHDGYKKANELGVELRLSESLTPVVNGKKTLKRYKCICPWMYLSINYRGEISYCDCRTEPTPKTLSEYNVFEQPFLEIWNGPSMMNMRKAFCDGIDKVAQLEAGCAKCSLVKYVDFEDYLYSSFSSRVVNNRQQEY